ncbi:hypothetical protein ACHAW6_005471 [Cyclotella cf. meneghiniana]
MTFLASHRFAYRPLMQKNHLVFGLKENVRIVSSHRNRRQQSDYNSIGRISSARTAVDDQHQKGFVAIERDQQQSTRSSSMLEMRIRDLENHPAVVWNVTSTFASMHKKKLTRRHLPLFDRTYTDDDHDFLFDKFAKAVCVAGVVARKEVFETWASALHIYYCFLCNQSSSVPLRRVADVAAGHGLLAWALLILDDEEISRESEWQNEKPPLTAFCLDVQMPPSAELIYFSMIESFPHLKNRFHYVEGRLEQLVPHNSCLLAGVHACGTLSDILVSTAADLAIPLALVPCCHSRKAKVLQACASPFAKEEYDAILNTKGIIPDLAYKLDEARIVALKKSGMNVVEACIPKLFTDKNRLIMARPIMENTKSISKSTPHIQSQTNHKSRKIIRTGNMPPLSSLENTMLSATMIKPKARFMKGFYVPCKDDHENRSVVSRIAGRLAAVRRKKVMHNRNHNETPQLDISMWLPLDGSNMTEQSLSNAIKSNHPHVQCSIAKLGDVYIHPKTERRAQTFRIQYRGGDEYLSFDEANRVHKTLRDTIPLAFPGAECR